MKAIVISHPESFEDEGTYLQQMFDLGLEVFHLRKPTYTASAFEDALKQLSPTLYKRIVIHSHYNLVEKYNLKGIHLTKRFIEHIPPAALSALISVLRKKGMTVSGSFHSIKALEMMSLKLDYVFVSPVFDSLSKPGYVAGIDLDEAEIYLKKKRRFAVLALGGVQAQNINRARQVGFDGAAILGAVWNENNPTRNYQMIIKGIDK